MGADIHETTTRMKAAVGYPAGVVEAAACTFALAVGILSDPSARDMASGVLIGAIATLLIPKRLVGIIFPDLGAIVAAVCLCFAIGGAVRRVDAPLLLPIFAWVGIASWLLVCTATGENQRHEVDWERPSMTFVVLSFVADTVSGLLGPSPAVLPGWVRVAVPLAALLSCLGARRTDLFVSLLWVVNMTLWANARFLDPMLLWVRVAVWITLLLSARGKPAARIRPADQ